MVSWLLRIFTILCLVGVENAFATISAPSASSDSTNLYYQFSYSGATPKFFQVFLDTDQNSTTGFSIGGIGANYLLENGNLYRYSGTGGAWGWTGVKTVSMTNSNSTVRWAVAKSDVGSPSALKLIFRHDNPLTMSVVISQTVTSVTSDSISLSVAGAPNLPYNGTSTKVTVGFIGATPSKVTLARDGLAAFATWPGGTFFTLSSDGKSISGNWCISASCWGYRSGSHVLTAVATYADGSTKSSSVTLNVADSTTTTTSTTTTSTTSTSTTNTTTTTTLQVSTTGPTYYVSPSGNDANSGSASSPWRTIQKAANTVVAGDTVILMDGTYEEPSIGFNRSGTAAKPIVFKAQNKWMAVLASTSGCNPGFSINASYIKVKDIRFSVSSRNQTCGTYTSANVHIRAWNTRVATPSSDSTGSEGFGADGIKVDFESRSEGVKSNQDYTIIENSVIDHSIELFSVKDSIIRNNVVTNQDPAGVSILAKGGVRNAQIYGNTVYNKRAGGRGIIIGGYSCDACFFDTSAKIEAYNTVAYNNVVINQSSGTMTGLDFEGARDSAFFNNVVVGGAISMTVGGHNDGFQYPTTNPTFKNNIVVCNGSFLTSGGFGWSYSGTLTVDYNNFYNCSSSVTQSHPISGNPMFVNQLSDWHLQAGSPAINSGSAVTMPAYGGGFIDVSRDFNGVVRSTPWDLGIYNTP